MAVKHISELLLECVQSTKDYKARRGASLADAFCSFLNPKQALPESSGEVSGERALPTWEQLLKDQEKNHHG